jgi:hypothetical protein
VVSALLQLLGHPVLVLAPQARGALLPLLLTLVEVVVILLVMVTGREMEMSLVLKQALVLWPASGLGLKPRRGWGTWAHPALHCGTGPAPG